MAKYLSALTFRNTPTAVDHESLLRRYRMLMVAIGFLYPAWRFGAYYINPNSVETWEQRGLIAVFFLIFSLLTYRVSYFRRNVATYFNIITYIWFIQAFYLLIMNDLSSEYLITLLVVIFAAGSSFLDPNAMLWYYLMCISLTGAMVIAKPDGRRVTFFWGVVTAVAVSYIGLRSMLKLFRDLEQSKNTLQKKTDEFMTLSSAVQTLFLPDHNELRTENWHIAGFYRPMDACGGDWWCYSEHQGKLTVMVGDVTGHGPGPAMITASIAAYTRALQKENPEMTPQGIFLALNKYLIELQSKKPSSEHYLMTIHALELDLNNKQITSWSTGAPPAAILGADGSIRSLGESGTHLGMNSELHIGRESCSFCPGERILLFTDGLIEVTSKDRQMTDRHFIRLASEGLSLSPLQATHALISKVDKFRGKTLQQDDYTLVVLDVMRDLATRAAS